MFKQLMSVFVIALLLLPVACQPASENKQQTNTKEEAETKEWVVKWKAQPKGEFLRTVDVLRQNDADNTMLVKVKPDVDEEKWLVEWQLDDQIEYIQPNFDYKLNNEPVLGEAAQWEPPRDYFLQMTKVFEALPRFKPQRDVTIAVIDTGVDTNHPLIAPHLVKQTNVLSPGEGADDITEDDVLYPEERGKTAQEIEQMYNDNEDYGGYDDYLSRTGAVGHGTSVIGVLLQTLGLIDGDQPVAPTKHSAKIMPVKVMGYRDGVKEGGSDFDMAEAIRLAVNRGADIISLSLGDWAYSKNARDAVAYAEQSGVLVTAAAGNRQGSINEPIFYPAAFPTVLAVGGVTTAGVYDPYSNRGPGIDLVAPDEMIWTTHVGGGFRYIDGNSFATPQVAAAAAVVMQHDPAMSPERVRNFLRQTADSYEDGWSEQTGYGRLNMARLLTELPKATIFSANDSQERAARVSVDSAFASVLRKGATEEWFKFDVPKIGTDINYHLKIHVKLPRALEKGVEMRVKRPGKGGFVTYNLTKSDDVFVTVDPGEVYLSFRFAEDEPSPYVSYNVETKIMPAPDAYADNDHPWNAYELDPLNDSLIEGTFHKEGVHNWFRVKTPEAGNLTVKLYASSPRINPVLFIQQLGGTYGVLLDEGSPLAGEERTIRAEAGGVYYIRVSDGNMSSSMGKYDLWIKYEPLVADSNEPSNSSEQALYLPNGTAVNASLSGSVDYDWYKFQLTEESEVTLTTTIVENDAPLELVLYNEKLTAVANKSMDPRSGELKWTEKLSAGKYFVRVRRLSGTETTAYQMGASGAHLRAPDQSLSGE